MVEMDVLPLKTDKKYVLFIAKMLFGNVKLRAVVSTATPKKSVIFNSTSSL